MEPMREVPVLAVHRLARPIGAMVGHSDGVQVVDDRGAVTALDAALCPVDAPRDLITAHSDGDDIVTEHPQRGPIRFPDEFGDSLVQVHWHPLDHHAVVWLTAGQEGQQSWLVRWDGVRGEATRLDADDAAPARFGPGGSWYLSADDERLRRLSWPGHRQLAGRNWDALGADGASAGVADGADKGAAETDGDGPGEDVAVIDDRVACWPSENGRLHLVDLATMTRTEEIYLTGHPVRTVGEIFPRLAGDRTPCSDVERIAALGTSGLLAVAHRSGVITLSRPV
jgi:hypothetical protein